MNQLCIFDDLLVKFLFQSNTYLERADLYSLGVAAQSQALHGPVDETNLDQRIELLGSSRVDHARRARSGPMGSVAT